MAFPSVSLTAAACLLMAACGGDRPAPPPSTDPPALASGPTPPPTTSSDPRAGIFVRKGCPQCHTISALGVKSPTELGPDLTFAYSDVQSRFNMKLEEFLKNPTGTMQVVLSSQIKLSPEERDSVIHILTELHEDADDAEEAEGND